MEQIRRNNNNKKVNEDQAEGSDIPFPAVLRVDYYTDPLCCWSWALEPQVRRLRYSFGDKIYWNNVMSGMLPDWKTYHDPMNSVTRPGQMGPVWKETQHLSGMPINDRIWVDDPPGSSYPACLAYKTAALQGRLAGELYLRKTREAVMTRAMNISKKEILLQLADELAADSSCFAFSSFRKDFLGGTALQLFRDDLKKVKIESIYRYPTLVFRTVERGLIMTGYRPYRSLLDSVRHLAPQLDPIAGIELEEYRQYWGTLTDRELEEVRVGTTVSEMEMK